MGFRERLFSLRKEMNMTQKEMSEELGIGLATLQRYENGKSIPGGAFFLNLLMKGINIDWLMSGDGDKIRWKTPATNPVLREIWYWLEHESRDDPGFNDWFRIQFMKQFPDFAEWRKKHKIEEFGE